MFCLRLYHSDSGNGDNAAEASARKWAQPWPWAKRSWSKDLQRPNTANSPNAAGMWRWAWVHTCSDAASGLRLAHLRSSRCRLTPFFRQHDPWHASRIGFLIFNQHIHIHVPWHIDIDTDILFNVLWSTLVSRSVVLCLHGTCHESYPRMLRHRERIHKPEYSASLYCRSAARHIMPLYY